MVPTPVLDSRSVPDSTAPPTPREWLAIVVLSAVTALAYTYLPVFWGG
jgi:hypothetical protein